MKFYILIMMLFISLSAYAGKEVVVESSETTTTPGIGGNAQVGFAFAKGDVISIDAHASKQLERMLAFIYPENIICRIKYKKNIHYSFTMPEDGIVIFRFISDQGGTNTIKYDITRTPATDATRNYDTHIQWKSPADHVGNAVPYRVAK